MPLYMCSKCGSVENTACGGYWRQQRDANYAEDFKPLCSACYPEIGKWHGDFPQRLAEGFVQSKDGFIYRQSEADGYFKHMGPFTPITLPETAPQS
ncbi:hypothetical protein [Bradyrhizobium stylosanthis]|uniref:Uncharacterized protein n=1 Tax=Bradyrhizobium stylosanthis TaxID=1803665 RepID=A0A560CXM2_9BRAD|nr:hypothetical protein [Bradyrhizobium stylosanthis]TWA89591.1 hypothetical protein FBZ96_11959 [Bradyrhizobium stylosanthis]